MFQRPTLLEFYADWCGPCTVIEPVMDKLEKDLLGYIDVVRVNVEDSSDLNHQFLVLSLPTFIFYQPGRPLKQIVGIRTIKELKQLVGLR